MSLCDAEFTVISNGGSMGNKSGRKELIKYDRSSIVFHKLLEIPAEIDI